MAKLRWNPHIMFDNDNIDSFWNEYFKTNDKVLFVLGKGFDIRMNLTLDRLLKHSSKIEITCILIEFNEGKHSSSHEYQHLIDTNLIEFKKLTENINVINKQINIWSKSGKSRRIVGDRNAANIFKNYSDISEYRDIIVDISSLPRGIYFSLIGKILSLIDTKPNELHNLFVSVAENVTLDSYIKETAIEDDLSYLHGFGGEIELESEKDKPLIWFPILGEGKLSHISKGADKIADDKNRLYEICPILPFPSKNPRRSDSLLIEYHSLLFDSLDIEAQNIMYVTERDPFQAYIELSTAIRNYKTSLDIIGGCKIAISTFSSKLLSIGSLLVAYENQGFVGIMNVNSGGYEINEEKNIHKSNLDSELFVTWLTGNPYKI